MYLQDSFVQKNTMNRDGLTIQYNRKNVLMGHILYDVKGEGAQQKIAKRCLDFVENNTNCYASCLNGPKQLR